MAALLLAGLAVAGDADAQAGPPADGFAATTANMTPAGLALDIDVLEWSDRESRASVVEALRSGSDIGEKLTALPSRGYVWVDGSSVGYSIKYAHRADDDGRGEQITLVIDRPLGSYSYEPWRAGDRVVSEGPAYSVIRLDLGSGVGHFTPIAEAVVDEENALVTLRRNDSAEPVLADVTRKPRPYWADDRD